MNANHRKTWVRAFTLTILIVLILTGAEIANGQSTAVTDDPVLRAMKSIESSVSARHQAAEKVIAASRLIDASSQAKKVGEIGRATEILKEAQKIAAMEDQSERGGLLGELHKRVDHELKALAPQANPSPILIKPEKTFFYALKATAKSRLNQYYRTLAPILEEERLPVGLLSVAFVESRFNPLALSPKGARGMWQFMPATAARYGLTVEPANDHRTHVEHSTRAAARYLRDLYRQFGDWKLAIAAYNAGENRVQRIINKTGIRDFDEMSRRGLLPLETRNYVPAVMSAWSQLQAGKSLRTSAGME
ncbi:MAG: lytic transglycosylase domain-containing protein [Acidobacteriota bacterium]